MLRSVAGRRYAAALLDIARDRGDAQLDNWAAQLKTVADLLSSPELAQTLVTPSVPVEAKQQVVIHSLGEAAPDLDPILRNMASLLVARGRAHVAPAIAAEFAVMVDDRRGVTNAEVITATPLDDDQQRRLTQALSAATKRSVAVQTRVDPGILGGLIIRLGDREVDASVAGRLAALRRQLI